MATYQSLYRRYRPQRFDEVLGQDHVTRALRNAVRDGRVGHAYLFSGPRGTGKTSTARILAKVLNCANPVDGEPCGVCENCVAVAEGRVTDWLLEQDAASKSKVDDMRDLLERVPLGTSGNRKVIILDEVHMLSQGAENALLKTLEEPPEHVVFVLATTDPQKVRPTIRSRAQHFEFRLLPPDVLADHVRNVIGDAGLGLEDDAIDHVVRSGGGSARDTLSALDQVAALGGVVDEAEPVDAIIDALCDRDAGAVLVAVADALASGRDPRTLGEALIANLRNAFLALMGVGDAHLTPADRTRAAYVGERLGAPGLTRALEVLGEALTELARKPDPRIVVEVALVRLTRADTDRSLDAILERLDRLERGLATPGAGPSGPAGPAGPEGGAAPASEPAASRRDRSAGSGAPSRSGSGTGSGGTPSVASARAALAGARTGAAGPRSSAQGPSGSPAAAPAEPSPEGGTAGTASQPSDEAPATAGKAAGGDRGPGGAGKASPAAAEAAGGGPESGRAGDGSPGSAAAGGDASGPAGKAAGGGARGAAGGSGRAARGSQGPAAGAAPGGDASATAGSGGQGSGPAGAAGAGGGAGEAAGGGRGSGRGGKAEASAGGRRPSGRAGATAPGPGDQASSGPEQAGAGGSALPAPNELISAWEGQILAQLAIPVRSKWRGGRWTEPGGDSVRFAVPNEWHQKVCEDTRRDVEEALAAHFGRRVPVAVVVDGAAAVAGEPGRPLGAPAPADPGMADDHDEHIDPSELRDADDVSSGGVDLLIREFGGQLVEEER